MAVMSVPPELRALCHQLSSTPAAQLPFITPLLLRNVSRCRGPLSSPSNATKAAASETSVLVHKLKTHISTLLHGKSVEGRFAAIVLVKGVLDVGGWEVLRGAESWVRGLLAILGKPQDPLASKRLCVVTLSSIYLQTHQYQSIVREITTPTLPTYLTSCLALLASKSTGKILDAPAPLAEAILDAFSALLPRHPSVFRPFAGQIRMVTRAYVAPTPCDGRFVPASLKESARALAVLVHQTAPKNTSGEEWGKAVRGLVKEIHATTDHVFRAVLEDWESTTGYISQSVDVNKELKGGGGAKEDYPAWSGIDAGLDRLTGLLGYLEEHFKHSTATAVTVPLGIIDDLLSRLMSVAPPVSKTGSEHGGMRLHPAISREEREGLWAGLPQVHLRAISIYASLVDRLQEGFTSLAQNCLEQITWAFSTDKQDESYRTKSYDVVSKILPLCGSSLPKTSVDRLAPIIVEVTRELRPAVAKTNMGAQKDSNGKAIAAGVTNADTFLKPAPILAPSASAEPSVIHAARALLPLLLAHLPPQHMEAYARAELDRTAILTHHKQAMLASVLHPFLGKNGKSLPSILPHLARAFPRDAAVEALLRPRQPVIQQSAPVMGALAPEDVPEDEEEDLEMADANPEVADEEVMRDDAPVPAAPHSANVGAAEVTVEESSSTVVAADAGRPDVWGVQNKVSTRRTSLVPPPDTAAQSSSKQAPKPAAAAPLLAPAAAAPAVEEAEDSDDESVHLEVGLSDSEDE